MPISRPSSPEHRAWCLLVSLLVAAAPLKLHAQSAAAKEGNAALERLRKALSTRPTMSEPRIPRINDLPEMDEEEDSRIRALITKRAPTLEMDARAQRAYQAARDARDAQQAAMAARLDEALGIVAAPLPDGANSGVKGRSGWVPVLFVSSSMPISTLRNYAAQMVKVRGVLAFRGVPGGLGKMEPMARLTAQMLRIDPGCDGPACTMRDVQVVVDPILFRQHGVSQVPALGMIAGDPTQPYCERDEEEGIAATHLVFGDAALSGLFEEYARLGGGKEVAHASSLLAGR
ncbi:type-F conjugative transfer system pilin assembly protein TrbC [Sphingobium naphthae]|nr:type-F conjugative transfer system pilin assembly protein TrbC [Sphingobium naphthae]